MHRGLTFLLAVSLSWTFAAASAAPITETARNAFLDKQLAAHDAALDENAEVAGKLCEAARAIAAQFDPDEWSAAMVDGCLADAAKAKGDMPRACALVDSQISHFQRVPAGLTWSNDDLQAHAQRNLRGLVRDRAAMSCH